MIYDERIVGYARLLAQSRHQHWRPSHGTDTTSRQYSEALSRMLLIEDGKRGVCGTHYEPRETGGSRLYCPAARATWPRCTETAVGAGQRAAVRVVHNALAAVEAAAEAAPDVALLDIAMPEPLPRRSQARRHHRLGSCRRQGSSVPRRFRQAPCQAGAYRRMVSGLGSMGVRKVAIRARHRCRANDSRNGRADHPPFRRHRLDRRRALGWWAANVALIGAWTGVFSGRRNLPASTVLAAAMVGTGAAYVAQARKVDLSAAAGGVPSVAWVAFATVHTAALWRPRPGLQVPAASTRATARPPTGSQGADDFRRDTPGYTGSGHSSRTCDGSRRVD